MQAEPPALQPSSAMLGSLCEGIEGAVYGQDARSYRLGRYQLSTLTHALCTLLNDEENRRLMVQHHFYITKHLMNLVKTFLEGTQGSAAGGWRRRDWGC